MKGVKINIIRTNRKDFDGDEKKWLKAFYETHKALQNITYDISINWDYDEYNDTIEICTKTKYTDEVINVLKYNGYKNIDIWSATRYVLVER